MKMLFGSSLQECMIERVYLMLKGENDTEKHKEPSCHIADKPMKEDRMVSDSEG